jgi:aspartate-semialdehyde dehydrogenase
MVGSVLMQRMQQEGDFGQVDPVFFTTSQVGDEGPRIGKTVSKLKDARSLKELKAMDIVISCQGADYTNETFPKLRAEGWDGYWIDAASALRMRNDAVIILDPVNRDVIDAACQGREELHRRKLHGEPHADGHARAVEG